MDLLEAYSMMEIKSNNELTCAIVEHLFEIAHENDDVIMGIKLISTWNENKKRGKHPIVMKPDHT